MFFPLADGRRLSKALASSRLEVIENARTFSMIDQPDRLAKLIADFAQGTVPLSSRPEVSVDELDGPRSFTDGGRASLG